MNMHEQMRKRPGHQKGFTLIEIAIVLVIIGLLLGGVLKGQELINTARVRSLNNTVDGITAAWFSFQDRYRAFPGDYSEASTNILATLTDGDGNGQVGTLTDGSDEPAERGQLWAHLEAAGYITGGFSGADVDAGTEYVCKTSECPDNGFGTGMSIFHGTEATSATVAAHELISGQGIPVDVLAELDRKVDDGLPNTGIMQSGNDAAYTGTCVTGATSADTYKVLAPSDNCAAVFRNF